MRTSDACEWRWVPGFESVYEVSNEGEVRSVDREVSHGNRSRSATGRTLRQTRQSTGHLKVSLCKGDGSAPRVLSVHRIVASAFPDVCGEMSDGLVVMHLNGASADNRAVNLAVATHSECAARVGPRGRHNSDKSQCPRGHLLADPNLVAAQKRLGRRQCLACQRANARVKASDPRFAAIANDRYEKLLNGAIG